MTQASKLLKFSSFSRRTTFFVALDKRNEFFSIEHLSKMLSVPSLYLLHAGDRTLMAGIAFNNIRCQRKAIKFINSECRIAEMRERTEITYRMSGIFMKLHFEEG